MQDQYQQLEPDCEMFPAEWYHIGYAWVGFEKEQLLKVGKRKRETSLAGGEPCHSALSFTSSKAKQQSDDTFEAPFAQQTATTWCDNCRAAVETET